MTREEMIDAIYTHDTIYLPPWEEGTPALEVALGCSWGKCLFCDFAKDTFKIHSLEKITFNMKCLGMLYPNAERLFLLGENAFCLSTQKLKEIFALTDSYMPFVQEFSMYARIDDIMRKTDQELKDLHLSGLSTLHIGVESGSTSILAFMNKGFTADDILWTLMRLDRIGIKYCVTVILGLGGEKFRNLHAIETGRLLSRVHPENIWCLKLQLWEDTPLKKMADKGLFTPLTPEEILLEERLLLENLNMTSETLYVDTTVLDVYTIQGVLPGEKDTLLQAVNNLIFFNPPEHLKDIVAEIRKNQFRQ